jgi:pyruvate dehydrogenase E2 component (dihydrolipoamide acetyltransferase)
VKSDIEAAVTAAMTAAPAKAAPPQAVDQPGSQVYDLVPHTMMRKVIAERLSESKQTVPHFYMTVDCEIDELLRARRAINERAPEGVRVSVNDFVIKALALALRETPDANASWSDEGVHHYRSIDLSVAVAVPGGLVTPIVRSADTLGLAAIATTMVDFAARARAGKLLPEEYQGGSASISNLGMYGIKQFDAVINPPQSCILAVGAGEPRPVVKDGELAVATVMSCTLSCDHRVVDGALGAQLLAAFKSLIECPAAMLL